MTVLTDLQIKLAEQMLLSVKNKEMNVTYSELAGRINPPIHHRQIGKNIGQVSFLCHELGLPLLSALVVNKNTHTAGEGFYPLYQMMGIPTNGKSEKELYKEERQAIRECKEWYRLEEHLGLHIGFEKPHGKNNKPSIKAQNATRIERTPWIIPCNPRNYDVDSAFSELSAINWKQGFKAEVGDTVYIYVAAPQSAIKYICSVEKTNLPTAEIDDSEYVVDGSPFLTYGNYMELRLVGMLETPISLSTLQSFGIKTIQGPFHAKPEIVALINSSCILAIDNSDGDLLAVPTGGLPPEYEEPNIHLFSRFRPIPFQRSVDVLNYGFGPGITGKWYSGWQRGSYELTVSGISFRIWFPKMSSDGEPASSSGWINTFSDDGETIIEAASDSNPSLGYEVSDQVRLVFTKTKSGPYLFAGVFLPDRERCTFRYHVHRKVADIADFSKLPPQINYYEREDSEDKVLISDLKNNSLTGAPTHFQFSGQPKMKNEAVVINGHKSFPRDRQTAINALSHADYQCEIDRAHPTFLRRNSSKPYTEPHHLIPMAFSDDFDVSLDVEENIVSLCSNCHNQIHYGQGAEELIIQLYNERIDLLRSVGIDLSLEQLLKYYC